MAQARPGAQGAAALGRGAVGPCKRGDYHLLSLESARGSLKSPAGQQLPETGRETSPGRDAPFLGRAGLIWDQRGLQDVRGLSCQTPSADSSRGCLYLSRCHRLRPREEMALILPGSVAFLMPSHPREGTCHLGNPGRGRADKGCPWPPDCWAEAGTQPFSLALGPNQNPASQHESPSQTEPAPERSRGRAPWPCWSMPERAVGGRITDGLTLRTGTSCRRSELQGALQGGSLFCSRFLRAGN